MEWRRHSRRPGVRAGRVAGFALLAVAVVVVADSFLLPLAVRGFVRSIQLIMNAWVWLALSISAGTSAWSILGVAGQALPGLLSSRETSVVLTVLVAVGVLAAYGLQRILGKEESSR